MTPSNATLEHPASTAVSSQENADQERSARVVVVGLASCFGCQLQITNIEQYLLDVLGQVDLSYWQLASSDPMPQAFDIAVIEGAVTTEESVETLKKLREEADVVITIGACATTAGIPGIAAKGFEERQDEVYGREGLPEICEDMISPKPVSAVIDVDYEVRCCPIDPMEFVDTLHRILHGSNKAIRTSTLCGECKRNERGCFYTNGTLCLGMVTRSGCGARCPNLGRPCNGCAGISPDANLVSARKIVKNSGINPVRFDEALEMFNQVNPDFVGEGQN